MAQENPTRMRRITLLIDDEDAAYLARMPDWPDMPNLKAFDDLQARQRILKAAQKAVTDSG